MEHDLDRDKLVPGLPRMPAAPAAHVNPGIGVLEPALERADHARVMPASAQSIPMTAPTIGTRQQLAG